MSFSERTFRAVDLIPGETYVVTTEFTDYDGVIHHVGESWRFVSKSFLPYEDGLSLFVQTDGRNESFRLQWRSETQGEIIDNFSAYVKEREVDALLAWTRRSSQLPPPAQ